MVRPVDPILHLYRAPCFLVLEDGVKRFIHVREERLVVLAPVVVLLVQLQSPLVN